MGIRQSYKSYYIVLISVHGLMRGHRLELGRDADTGGQIKYVLELARALAAHPDVEKVDLMTRMVIDPKVSPDYSVPIEPLCEKANIVRIRCGPKRYLRKEVLWPYLDNFADQCLSYFHSIKKIPDIIHSHYADAGYVGSRLSSILGSPLVFTGHSLGRVKMKRLLEQGLPIESIEDAYHIKQRIDAEEMTLDYAGFEVASTSQEVEEQYKLYDNYNPGTMKIIPPGVDLKFFYPPKRRAIRPDVAAQVDRFLADKRKPIILAISRPDPRKNIPALIRAYGEDRALRERANLVIIAGNRDHIATMDKGARQVLTEILLRIDRYDLYGHVAYPKQHGAGDIPELYRLAMRRRGVFINPALTEPFGLTLIEAAACGVPIVATNDGGPRDIISNCKNGVLVDPFDTKSIAGGLAELLFNDAKWRECSENGLRNVSRFYSWESHVKAYLREVEKTIAMRIYHHLQNRKVPVPIRSRIPISKRIIIADVDNTLIGDKEALLAFRDKLAENKMSIGFGIVTGRSLESTLEIMNQWPIPQPEVIITSTGTEIYYLPNMSKDLNWAKHINYRWHPEKIREVMRDIPGVRLQADEREQGEFKISYHIKKNITPRPRQIKKLFRNFGIHANVVVSLSEYMDILPVRASKGSAVRFFAVKWGIPLQNIMVMGDSGNDEEMLKGEMKGVVVGNYSAELKKLRGRPGIYFAEGKYARGIIEGIDYYNFFSDEIDWDDENLRREEQREAMVDE